jgi:lysophospholipase L1-like esterase
MAIIHNRLQRFVFAGDRITESARSDDPEEIGFGYVRIVRDYLRAKDPGTAPLFVNRARGGLSIAELAARWQVDVIDERPDVLSILIDLDDPALRAADAPALSVDQFEANYRQILEETTNYLPQCRIVLCEPAAAWSEDAAGADDRLRPYVDSLLAMGRDYSAESVVPAHEALVYARRARPDIRWVRDDGQPTSSGHAAIAYSWLEANELARRGVG